jgi:hypothetical protein
MSSADNVEARRRDSFVSSRTESRPSTSTGGRRSLARSMCRRSRCQSSDSGRTPAKRAMVIAGARAKSVEEYDCPSGQSLAIRHDQGGGTATHSKKALSEGSVSGAGLEVAFEICRALSPPSFAGDALCKKDGLPYVAVEPSEGGEVWAGLDSNQRRRKASRFTVRYFYEGEL